MPKQQAYCPSHWEELSVLANLSCSVIWVWHSWCVQPHFTFMKAMSVGRTGLIESYNAITSVIAGNLSWLKYHLDVHLLYCTGTQFQKIALKYNVCVYLLKAGSRTLKMLKTENSRTNLYYNSTVILGAIGFTDQVSVRQDQLWKKRVASWCLYFTVQGIHIRTRIDIVLV